MKNDSNFLSMNQEAHTLNMIITSPKKQAGLNQGEAPELCLGLWYDQET